MSHEIFEIIHDAFENAKEVIDRFFAALKKFMDYFDKSEETATEAE